MANNIFKKNNESGFALLLTLLVVTVLISIGVSVLNLSIKQVRLASTATDSEVAFHAANAGLECALYWRREKASDMERGQRITPIGCFGVASPASYSDRRISSGVSGGEVYQYQYEFTWGSPSRCTQVNTIVGSSSISGTGLRITGMTNLVPSYPGGSVKTCDPGTKCSVISVQGYNKPCGSVSSYGTVQREVLLQL